MGLFIKSSKRRRDERIVFGGNSFYSKIIFLWTYDYWLITSKGHCKEVSRNICWFLLHIFAFAFISIVTVNIACYRENPVASEDEAVEEAEEDDDDDKSDTDEDTDDELAVKKKVTKSKPLKTADGFGDDDESDEFWGSDTDDTSSGSDDENDERYKDDPAARFRKKATDKEEEKPGKDKGTKDKEKDKNKKVSHFWAHLFKASKMRKMIL